MQESAESMGFWRLRHAGLVNGGRLLLVKAGRWLTTQGGRKGRPEGARTMSAYVQLPEIARGRPVPHLLRQM